VAQGLLKCFRFDRRQRSKLTFSDPAKINIVGDALQLKVQGYNRATGVPIFSTAVGLTATTQLTSPDTLSQWVAFGMTPTTSKQLAGATVQFKLNDGTDDRYWDGGTWAVAGAGDWSSESDVAANIASFPVTSKSLALVINLVTSDESVTPAVSLIDVWMNCDIDYLRSILADALIPSLRSGVQPVLDFSLLSEGGNRLNLRDVETKYNIASVVAAYDTTSDPGRVSNLFSSYDAASKTVELTSPVTRGNTIRLRFRIEPEVHLNWGSQDYVEVEALPAIVVDNVTLSGNEVFAQIDVRDPDAQQAHVRRFPFRLRFSVDVRLLAEKNRTLLSMMDRALEHLASTPLLPWPAVDEEISMVSDAEGLFQPRPNLSDKHEMGYSLVLHDVHLWLRPEELIPLVQRFNPTLLAPGLQGGPNWTDTKLGSSC
jgi:hypothetical protein